MSKRLQLLMGAALVVAAQGACAEALVIDRNTDTCHLFEALNGPDNMPENCRQTKSTSRGISIKPVEQKHYDRAMLPDISFEYGSEQLSDSARLELNKVVTVMADAHSANQRYRIEGNTDRKGSAAYNVKLSKARAEAVKLYLTENGVPEDRLKAVGNGYKNLLDPSRPYDGINRRVEFLNQAAR